jgi:opacity protein-like surface antigen
MSGKKVNRTLVALAALALAWPAVPAAADAQVEPGWRLRFSLASMDFDSNLSRGSGYGIDVGAAVAVNGEYRFNRRLGLDLGAFGGGGVDVVGHRSWIAWSHVDVYDTMSVGGLTAGLDVHLTPDSRVDVYVCPMVALMQFGGLVFEVDSHRWTTAVDFDEDLALGASLGLSVPFGERQSWWFNTYLTHLESTLNGGDRTDLRIEEDYDVSMFGLGFGYRF